MARVVSLVAVAFLMMFFSLPVAAVLLWAAVVVLGYTPSLWLMLFVGVGVVLNVAVLVGRSLHPNYRLR